MILSDQMISNAIVSGFIKIEPYEKEQVQPASYDLRIGDEAVSATSDGIIRINERGFFELKPGDFAIVMTKEKLDFDASHTARIGLRSKFARKGIIATTGPQVDPGFKGRLKIGITNLSPNSVTFSHLDDFITLEVHKLSEPARNPYNGTYQSSYNIKDEDISTVKDKGKMGFSSIMESMQSLSQNVASLTIQVKMIIWGMGIGFSFLGLLMSIFNFL